METISYLGFFNQLAFAEYGLSIREEGLIQRIDIVVVTSRKLGQGTSLWYTQEGRDSILNTLLATELKGVPVEFVRFFVLIDGGEAVSFKGMEFEIQLNVDDYVAKGNPAEVGREAGPSIWGRFKYWVGFGDKVISYYSRGVVAGCAEFYTDDAHRRLLGDEELRLLCTSVGYVGKREGMPTWMAPLLSTEL